MKRLLFFGTIACFMLASCSKDKFETVPQITIKSFGPDEVVKGQLFELVAEITDKEGDIQDSALLVRKRFTNGTIQVSPRTDDSTFISLKDFNIPNKTKVELRIIFAYGEDIPGTRLYNIQENVDRSVTYTLQISDKAKNKSQLVETKKIILKKFNSLA